MKKTKSVFCMGTLLLIVLSANASCAESPYIFAAGIKLTVGMDRDIALSNLKKSHKVEKNTFEGYGNDSWFVKNLKTNEIIAQVSFKDGELTCACHDLRIFDERDKSFSMAKSLFNLISNITKNEVAFISIRSKTERLQELTIQKIILSFQNKEIIITLIYGDKQQTVQIGECIFK